MKKISFLLTSIFGIALLLSCGKNNGQIQIEEQTEIILEDKYLITTNSVGYFKIGGSWQDIAKNDYNYKSFQYYGSCVDGCCGGGFLLGDKIIEVYEGTTIENLQITIGTMVFDRTEDYEGNKHKSNPNVFYPYPNNCGGWWYWKDKTDYIVVYSDLFKTKEGIGVGTTLEEVQEKFGKIHFYVGWIEEDENALTITLKSYPNIEFVLNVNDYKGNWEEISLLKDENSLTISDFKKNTKIQRLIVNQTN